MNLHKHRRSNMFILPVVTLFVLSCSSVLIVDSAVYMSNTTETFIADIIKIIGGVRSLTLEQFSTTFQRILSQDTSQSACLATNESLHTNMSGCITDQCLSGDDILKFYGLSQATTLTTEDLYRISPALLHNFVTCDLGLDQNKEEIGHKKTGSVESWGYSFLFVTLINVCSLAGAFVLPFMKKSVYKKILMFMVALAVGSLTGSGLLVLVPEAFGFLQDPSGSKEYIWKSSTIVGGVYLFFVIERFLKIIFEFRKHTLYKNKSLNRNSSFNVEVPFLSEKKQDEENELKDCHVSSIKRSTPINSSQKYKDTSKLQIPNSKTLSSSSSTRALDESFDQASTNNIEIENDDNSDNHVGNGDIQQSDRIVVHGHSHGDHPIKIVAWMIIFGDGVHNFIDGLSIGAAFTDSIFAGISISIAVICEELPHELGDFAILLNAGMSVKRALFYNFLSACMCYFGLVIGIILGENTTAHTWIFAIAGGMFLYIALVDMMPEMNSAAEDKENKKQLGVTWIFFIQNIGMLIGYGVILIMAIFGSEIDIK